MDSPAADEKFIDVENVIRKKNPKLLRAIPSFVTKYIKKILHQDKINWAIHEFRNDYGKDFVHSVLNELGTNYESYGSENIPVTGRFIFAANHPLGGLDGMVLIDDVGKHFANLKFVVNDLLLNLKNLEPVFVPVNKHGRQSVDYARRIEETYSSDEQVLYFPAGLCSRKMRGTITDLEWHKSFIKKAVQYKRDIIPVYIEGRNSAFFYNLANIRKVLGIKANIEMLYLADEMFKQSKKKITLRYGKPIPYTLFDSSKRPAEWADEVRKIVYSLKA